MLEANLILCGDALDVLRTMPNDLAHCCVTSAPVFKQHDGGLGDEESFGIYLEKITEVFREVLRVLRPDGTCWLNLSDCYVRRKLVGVPWKVVFALQDVGWHLRQDIIWAKSVSGIPTWCGSVRPESVQDRFTQSHEYVFLMSKQDRYRFDVAGVREPSLCGNEAKWDEGMRKFASDPSMRNRRSVWAILPTHYATPLDLVEICVVAGCPDGGIVLDPFLGSGTTGVVATRHNRQFIGIDINQDQCKMALDRVEHDRPERRTKSQPFYEEGLWD
jgi:DNA modification methylase